MRSVAGPKEQTTSTDPGFRSLENWDILESRPKQFVQKRR